MSSTVSTKVYEILNEAVNGNIEHFKITVHNPNKKGDGYLGQLFFISLHDNIKGRDIHLVVKQAFADPNIREFFPIKYAFVNEIYFYTKLWPKLLEFQEEIPQELHFSHVPRCLTASSEENHERLVLENLKNQGFVMHEKRNPLEAEKLNFIFKVYGRFHAMSLAYKALHPEEFSVLTSGVIDVWDKFSLLKNFQEVINLSCEQCLDSLQAGKDDAIIEEWRHYIENSVELFRKSLACDQYSCIIHGDCWSNNTLFKYDDCGELMDIRLLDFQMVKMGSPICDLAYCLYSSGTKEDFNSLDRLLQVYYDSLSRNLEAYGCDPEELYPLKALKTDWKCYCQLGVIMSLILWRGKLTYDGDVVDVTDLANQPGDVSKFFDAKFDEKSYKERTRDIIVHLFEKGYLFS